jgi:DNA-binding MarR family transcriptional regulator
MSQRARPARPRADARRDSAGRPRRAPPDSAIETADRLHSAAIHLLRRVRREDAASGLPAPRLSALSVVVFRGPLTVSDLAAAEQVRPPTMTRIVTALQEAGLVKREIDPADRRVVRVRATPRGVTVLQEGRRRRVAVLARELASLPKAELRSLARAVGVLERIVGPRHV